MASDWIGSLETLQKVFLSILGKSLNDHQQVPFNICLAKQRMGEWRNFIPSGNSKVAIGQMGSELYLGYSGQSNIMVLWTARHNVMSSSCQYYHCTNKTKV